MSTELDELLESIDPERTLDKVNSRINNAFNSFQVKMGLVKSWNDFKILLSKFFCHIENSVLQLNPPRNEDIDIDWGHCIRLLNKEYQYNGEKLAFEMARTGNEGGLYAVLKTIAKQMTQQYTSNEISSKIYHFWNKLSIDEQLKVTTQYLEKYGHLIPPELKEGSAARLKANFPKVLEQHPHLTKRLRQIGRTYTK